MKSTVRPLSPHLRIYRWRWTMVGSILHRASGVALAVGAVLLAGWLMALSSGPQAFALAHGIMASLIGQGALLGWTWALFYHLLNGLRHLMWDSGRGLTLPVAARTGRWAVAGSVVLTALTWAVALL